MDYFSIKKLGTEKRTAKGTEKDLSVKQNRNQPINQPTETGDGGVPGVKQR